MSATSVDAAQVTAWHDELAAFPSEARDVYFTPEYHALDEDGTAEAFVFRSSGDAKHRLLVPGMAVRVPGSTYVDLQTPNGYGGPLVTSSAPADFVEEAWDTWRTWARERRIVAAFFRLHPLLDARAALPRDAEIRDERTTVYVPLEGGRQAAWTSAETRHRNMVSRGDREGMTARWNDGGDWEEFLGLYGQAMDRLGADARLRFSADHFARLRKLDGAAWVAARDDDGLVAAHVFLFGPVWGHYHLAARRADAPNYAMNWLLQQAIDHALARGLRGIHLGGGASPGPGDGVFRFKRSLGGELRTFQVARVIADPIAYAGLIERWSALHGVAPTWLLGYRQPAPPAADRP